MLIVRRHLSPREMSSREVQCLVPYHGNHDVRVRMLFQVLLPAVLGRGVSEISPVSHRANVLRRVPDRCRVLSLVSGAAKQGMFGHIAGSMVVMFVARWVTLFEIVHRGQEVTWMPEHHSSSRGVDISAHRIQDLPVQSRLLTLEELQLLSGLLSSHSGKVAISRFLLPMAEFLTFQQHQRFQCTSSQNLPW